MRINGIILGLLLTGCGTEFSVADINEQTVSGRLVGQDWAALSAEVFDGESTFEFKVFAAEVELCQQDRPSKAGTMMFSTGRVAPQTYPIGEKTPLLFLAEREVVTLRRGLVNFKGSFLHPSGGLYQHVGIIAEDDLGNTINGQLEALWCDVTPNN